MYFLISQSRWCQVSVFAKGEEEEELTKINWQGD